MIGSGPGADLAQMIAIRSHIECFELYRAFFFQKVICTLAHLMPVTVGLRPNASWCGPGEILKFRPVQTSSCTSVSPTEARTMTTKTAVNCSTRLQKHCLHCNFVFFFVVVKK
jgi:hypothetical protein